MDAKYIVECIAIILFNLTESELYLQGEPVSVQTVFRSVWSGVTSAPMERDPAHFKPGSEPTSAYEVLTVQTDYHWETWYTHTHKLKDRLACNSILHSARLIAHISYFSFHLW